MIKHTHLQQFDRGLAKAFLQKCVVNAVVKQFFDFCIKPQLGKSSEYFIPHMSLDLPQIEAIDCAIGSNDLNFEIMCPVTLNVSKVQHDINWCIFSIVFRHAKCPQKSIERHVCNVVFKLF